MSAAPGTAPDPAVLARAGLPDLAPVLAGPGHPLVFATVSGAHLYGFPSRDSDVDLRGAHLLPLRAVLALDAPPETSSRMWDHDGTEMDLVTHDLAKFARLLLRRNGYVLEQLLSPLVAHTSPVHADLVALAPRLLTRHHAHHYRGFARGQWQLFGSTGELKPLLYAFRVILTGIHLMRSGEVVAHLPELTGLLRAPRYLGDLVAAKADAEHGLLSAVDGAPAAERLDADVRALHGELDDAQAGTRLPEAPDGRAELSEIVVDARLQQG